MKKEKQSGIDFNSVQPNGTLKLKSTKRRLNLKKKEAIAAWLFLSPVLLGFLVFTAFSMIYSLYISFTDWNILSDPKWVGFSNYIRLFTKDIYFWDYFLNTLFYVVMLVPIVLVVSLGFAVLLNKKSKGLTPFYRACLYIPCIVSTVAISVVWRWLLNYDAGVVNGIIRMFGIQNPPGWLISEKYAKSAIVMMRVWQMSGYYMVLFLAGLQNIPENLYEAAEIDGAGKWQKLWKITIPMLRPTTFAITILLVLEAFNIFEVVLVMTDGGLNTSSLMYYVYSLGFVSYKMGYASALAWVLFLIILSFTILRFALKKDETL